MDTDREHVEPVTGGDGAESLLELRGIDKHFGPVQALTKVDLDLPAGMLVLDMTANTLPSELLKGAAMRGCDIVQPLDLLLDLLELQAKTLTGKVVPREVIRAAIPERFLDEG